MTGTGTTGTNEGSPRAGREALAEKAGLARRPRGKQRGPGSYGFIAPAEALYLNFPMRSTCEWCDWEIEGPAGENIVAAKAHRKQEHPKARDRGPKARQRAAKNANPKRYNE